MVEAFFFLVTVGGYVPGRVTISTRWNLHQQLLDTAYVNRGILHRLMQDFH
jgi:hypothetical protein